MDHILPKIIPEDVEIASLLDAIADARRRLDEIKQENNNQRASLASNCQELRNQRVSLRSSSRELTALVRSRRKAPENGIDPVQNGVNPLKEEDHPPRRRPTQLERLTHREIEVLRLIAEGLNTKMIAARLGISFKTAVCHRSHILEKLNCHESATLVRLAMQAGLVA